MDFIAETTNPILSFLAVGTPAGEPPFSLLDGVSMTDNPEAATAGPLGLGLLAVPIVARLMKKRR